MKFDIAIIGDLSKDKIIVGKEASVQPGGAVLYGSMPIAKMAKVAVITKLAQKDFPLLNDMKQAGVSLFPTLSAKTTEFENIYYDPFDLDKRKQKVVGISDPFKIKDIPEIEVKIFHIAPSVSGIINLRIIKNLAQRARISLDVQGFMRKVKGDGGITSINWLKKRESLPYVDILKTDRVEAEFLTKNKDPYQAAEKLASYGPKEILITSNEGLLVYAFGKFFKEPFTAKSIRGRTGRGDTCIASYLAKRIKTSPEKAARFAAYLTSLKLETPGPLKISTDPVEEFRQLLYN